MSKKSTAAPATIATQVKQRSLVMLKVIVQRRQIILCILGVLAAAGLLLFLIRMLPRTAKPTAYRAGELEIEAITQVVGYRKVLGVTESLSGLGRAQAGSYTYRAGEAPSKDVEAYKAWLQEEYGAAIARETTQGEQAGSLTLTLPTKQPEKLVELSITYDAEQYLVAVEEKVLVPPKPEKVAPKITPEQAEQLMLTLTKAETGFKADISVYAIKLEEERAQVDGWDYYVFTVLADYSATRIEYRGTFYISCHDGLILRYDKDAGTTSRVRGAQ